MSDSVTSSPPVSPRLAMMVPEASTISTLGGRGRHLPIVDLRHGCDGIADDAGSADQSPDAKDDAPVDQAAKKPHARTPAPLRLALGGLAAARLLFDHLRLLAIIVFAIKAGFDPGRSPTARVGQAFGRRETVPLAGGEIAIAGWRPRTSARPARVGCSVCRSASPAATPSIRTAPARGASDSP